MPKTKDGGFTAKELKFIELFLLYNEATKAYHESYGSGKMKPETITRNAHRVRHKPRIAARIAEEKAKLSQEIRIETRITLEFITGGILHNIARAEQEGEPAIAIAGYVQLAKLHGLINKNPVADTPMVDDEAREIALRFAQRQMKLVSPIKAVKR